MIHSVDDGDGRAVLPVNVRLKQRTTKQGKTTVHKTPRPASGLNRNHFLTARERKSQRKESAMVEFMAAETARSARATMQTYEPVDVRVGDVVRIVGRIEEWMRKKADGSVEWVRQVTVADGSGGSICMSRNGQLRTLLIFSQLLWTLMSNTSMLTRWSDYTGRHILNRSRSLRSLYPRFPLPQSICTRTASSPPARHVAYQTRISISRYA